MKTLDMPKMTIEVAFLPGTGLVDALQEAKEKAVRLDMAYVKFTFNGVFFSVSQNANIPEEYYLPRDSKYVIFGEKR